ncbi:osmotically inducible protein OsmC [Marivirga sericea]|uniref:Osmotically inducible protein OsmC n=1 Tax=Marivirga sericea TaxID=1028 RepID=A0A1X7KFS1_9BACT|nr:OsmC family protein [Marivirga sericea]SMG39830.1 osmotically inducible protein OsmC [Marivirga sericea]
MAIKRKVNANWKGTGTEGKGHLSSPNNFFENTPYSFKSRFENEDGKSGTNPEELIAAAHSACYAMALSVEISKAGHTPDEIDANAEVVLDKEGEGFAIKEIKLTVKGKVSDLSEEKFLEMAEGAKKGCPISKALSAVPISLEASFEA